MTPTEWLDIGVVTRAQGIRGELRVKLFNPDSDALEHVEQVRIHHGTMEQLVTVRSFFYAQHDAVLSCVGITDRNAAEALAGSVIAVDRHQLPPLEDSEFYCSDLIGIEVVDEQGIPVGTIREVLSNAAQDTFVIVGPTIGEVLVPVVDEYVVSVDVPHHVVKVRSIQALIDL